MEGLNWIDQTIKNALLLSKMRALPTTEHGISRLDMEPILIWNITSIKPLWRWKVCRYITCQTLIFKVIIYVLRVPYFYNITLRYLVDCEWGEWKTTVNCTDTCGGKKHLEREQTQGVMYGGKQCETKPGHTQILKCCDGCKDKKCPGKMLPCFL